MTHDPIEKLLKRMTPPIGEIPNLRGIDIAGTMIPCEAVGGDYARIIKYTKEYDFKKILEYSYANHSPNHVQRITKAVAETKNRTALIIADFEGHGTQAAIYAAQFDAILDGTINQQLREHGEIRQEFIDNISDYFHHRNIHGTMIFGEITSRGIFRFMSAGHASPYIFSKENNALEDISSKNIYTNNMMLGVRPPNSSIRIYPKGVIGYEPTYQINEWEFLNNGDLFIIYSDGLIDPAQSSQYTLTQLQEVLRKTKNLPAKTIVECIVEDRARTGNIDDDISVIVVKKN
ncbi:MAG: PP2C family protein-serine/threonine phosphatase [Candidatus Woesearchaeota archaeon]